MENPFTEILETAGKVTYVIFALVLGMIIILAFASVYSNNQTTINHSIAELCGLDSTIRNNIDQSLMDSLPGDTWQELQTKDILHRAMIGESILDSEYQIVFDVLSVLNKKKLQIDDLEIGCNLLG